MVYELLARAGELTDEQVAAQVDIHEGLRGPFFVVTGPRRKKLLEGLLKTQPQDTLAKVYLRRVREYASSPPEPAWEGVFKLDEK